MPDTHHGKSFQVTERNKVRRKPNRGSYDTAAIYPILDSAMLCHIAYVIDGQPYCTPTGFWREGDHLYWHGSSASRMLRAQKVDTPVCLTVTHMDAIVLARSGFNHSINYRSVMAYGRASIIEDGAEKLRAMDAFVDRFFPGRADRLRKPTTQEIKATTFIGMEIENASGKIRDLPVADDEEDYSFPLWAASFPITTVVGPAVECARQLPDQPRGDDLDAYTPGRRLDEVMLETYRTWSGE